MASGKILTWLNSDDYYFSDNVLDAAKDHLDNQDKYSFLIGDFYNVDENGKKIKSFISYISNKKINKNFFINQIFTGSLFFKNECFSNFKNFNTKYKYAFEYELLAYLAINYYGKHINKFLACFRITKNQLSSNKKELTKEFFEILESYNLNYSNSKLLRIESYIKQGSFIRFLYYKFRDFF